MLDRCCSCSSLLRKMGNVFKKDTETPRKERELNLQIWPFLLWSDLLVVISSKKKIRKKLQGQWFMTQKSYSIEGIKVSCSFKINGFKHFSWSNLGHSTSHWNISTAPSRGCVYLLLHTLGNLHVFHGDELAEFLQSVNIANLIHELNTAEDINKIPISRYDMILITSTYVSAILWL